VGSEGRLVLAGGPCRYEDPVVDSSATIKRLYSKICHPKAKKEFCFPERCAIFL
jgi:hypothetical protein